MAKKKKLAANPARGFATTSVASKPKPHQQQQESSQQQSEGDGDSASPATSLLSSAASGTKSGNDRVTTSASASTPSALASSSAAHGKENGKDTDKDKEKELKDLSPAELEAALEAADLQAFVERHSARGARDAARLVGRVLTERRLLRKAGQATKLDVRRALGDALLGRIVELARAEVALGGGSPFGTMAPRLGAAKDGGGARAGRGENKGEGAGEDEAVARMWTLQRALLGLGFAAERVDDALGYALRNVNSPSADGRDASGGASIWAFDECLDWLALNLDESELPDFGAQGVKTAERGHLELEAGADTPSVSSELSEAEDMDQPPELRQKDAEQQQLQRQGHGDQDDEAATNVEDAYVSDLESDLEPDDLLSIYLDTKARLYEVQPELTETNQSKGKSGKKQVVLKTDAKTPKAKKLLAKLQKIESDALFDSQTAAGIWTQKRNEVAYDLAERRKLGLSQTNGTTEPGKKTEEVRSIPGTSTPTGVQNNGSPSDSDDDGAFGGLFDSVASTEQDGVSAGGNQSGDVITRDFGRATGVSPRRILEDSCRARDSRARLKYTVVSKAAFSSRQSLTIKWSKNQTIDFPLEISSVPSKSTPDACNFIMNGVATPDARQSESYVSVVALYQIFSTSAKEEKVYLRLPGTWRDLWFEFVAQRKRDSDLADVADVRHLRATYNAANEAGDNTEERLPDRGRDEQDHQAEAVSNDASHYSNGSAEVNDEQHIRDIWHRKSSAPSYHSMLSGRTNLPIFQFREAALSAIDENQVTIICGETGCGKSTQMPAFILEQEMQRGKDCKIYCTEPRRISAITLAQRVSQELGESKADLGTMRSLVGYAIRLESQVSASTRLVYATTGIVLRMLESKDGLKSVTHVVIDEVHERSIETDFLLIILRTLITKRPDLKVILMSATVDANRFSRYFTGAPILNVPGRTFPVDTRFLEDAVELTGHVVEDRAYDDDDDDVVVGQTDEEAERLSKYSKQTRQTLAKLNEYRIDYGLIVNLITRLCSDPEYEQYSKAILVFLPGIGEIRQLSDVIHGTPMSRQCVIHALHSAIPSEDQQKAFQPPPRGMRKIVISTNIAETGVTIPDVTCVIDTGKHKEMRFDERRQISRLVESFISRANAKQRRGRAGRVQAGLCFHLFTMSRHDKSIAGEQTPEMLRLSLQDLIMRVKICKLGDIQTTLASALDPPSAKNIRRAIDTLVEVGALTSREDLTPLGQQLSKLPLDPYLGKLVLHGAVFGCLDIVITLAAILTSKSPFVTPLNGRQQAAAARAAFAKGDSDLLTDYNAYASWRRICTNTPTGELSFCRKNLLSAQTLANIEDLKAQLLSSLADAGLAALTATERSAVSRVSNSGAYSGSARYPRRFTPTPAAHAAHAEDTNLASALIASAFYPKLLTRDSPDSSATTGSNSSGFSKKSKSGTGAGAGWRNVATNQPVTLHPSSILRATPVAPWIRYLSFYSIMQGAGGAARNYNAMALTPAPPLFLALLAGGGGSGETAGVAFHDIAAVLSFDGGRVRFAVEDAGAVGARWKAFAALKFLRRRVGAFVALKWGGGRGSKGKRDRDVDAEAVERALVPWTEVWEELLERCAVA